MTAGESGLLEITTVKDGLLDSQQRHETEGINGALQSQWQVIRDGIAQGVTARASEAAEQQASTSVAMAGSFGVGAAFSMAMKAGGRWAAAAEVVGTGMLGLMGVDLYHRGQAVHEAYSRSSADSLAGQMQRKEAIASNIGGGLVDYSMMIASGGLGAASVHFAPKLSSRISTSIESLPRLTMPEPALQPVRVSSNFKMMELGENGRLGAREVPGSFDPVAAAREKLDFPHRKVGLDQLSSLLEAKQIAAHPQVRPLYEKLGETLGKIDRLKPQISGDESAIAALSKQLTEIKGMKPELQAVRAAETAVNGIKADLELLPALRERQSSLTRQIQEAKTAEAQAAEGALKKAKENQPASVETLKAERREVSDSISNIQQRSKDLAAFEQRLALARENFSLRREAIESGKDPQILAIEAQLKPLQDALAVKQTELARLVEDLKSTDGLYTQKASEVKPTLAASDSAVLPSLPRYERPKIDLPEPPKAARPKVETKAPESTPKPSEAASKALEKPPLEIKPTRPAEAEAAVIKPEISRVKAPIEAPAARTVGKEQVDKSFVQAKRAVDDFAATQKRHTTALKQVYQYIDDSFAWFASDAQAASHAGKVASNVEGLLAGLKDWNRPPGWIRSSDRAQLMQRNGLDAAAMERFDLWYQAQNKPFHEGRGLSPDRRLVDIRDHLSRRVAVESVKNWLRTAPDMKAAVSPIAEKGFQMVASGKLPDGRAIPKGSDMIVFEKRAGKNGNPDTVLPFAKDGHYMQRFDDVKISSGLAKLEAITSKGPQGLKAEEIYAFRLDHDPGRLMSAAEQVGFAILRPGSHGKNILYMEFANGIDKGLIPKALRADSPQGAGTNTGVLYNLLREKPKS